MSVVHYPETGVCPACGEIRVVDGMCWNCRELEVMDGE